MNCPYCSYDDTSVLESRVMVDGVGMKRRRECKKCHKRYSTLEKVVNLDLKVVKKDGRVEDFDREKVMKGIKKACWKRLVGDEEMEVVVDDIEMKLLNRKTTRIPSGDIGKMILTRLKKLDDVAYLRFASVYLDFESASDFEKFITNLKTENVNSNHSI
ncbi:transcriptional repressor NrdR [Candidatus Collierbacteria bacterium]|nr:transcriptional repressor NrdR [Candidatus Collierbacteria bacterium]